MIAKLDTIIEQPFTKYSVWLKAVFILLGLITAGIFAIYLKNMITLISDPFPTNYREAAVLDAAMGIQKGINIYSLEAYPQYIYLYGFIPPYLTAFFLNFFEPSLSLTNGIYAAFSLLTILCTTIFMLRNMKKKTLSLLVFIITFLSMILTSGVGSKLSDAGFFFMMLSVFIAVEMDFSWQGMLLSGFSSLIALHFKSYFVYSFPVICLFVFLFRSKRRGLFSMLTALATYIISYIVLSQVWPLYLNYSIFHHLNTAAFFNLEYMLHQLLPILIKYWGFFAISIAFLIHGLYNILSFQSLKGKINFKDFHLPLIKSKKRSWLFFLLSFISFVLFIISLGGNVGASPGQYFNDLSAPFLSLFVLLVVSDSSVDDKDISNISLAGLLICFIILFLSANYTITNTSVLKQTILLALIIFIFFFVRGKSFFSISAAAILGIYILSTAFGIFWNSANFSFISPRDHSDLDRLSSALSRCNHVYASAYVFPYTITASNVSFYDNGLTEYAHLIGYPEKIEAFFPISSQIDQRDIFLKKYFERHWEMKDMIASHELDCIAATPMDEIVKFQFISDDYEIIDKFQTGLDRDIPLYVPKGSHPELRNHE